MKSIAILIVSSTASDTGVRVAKALVDTGCKVTVLCSSMHVSRVIPHLRIISTKRHKSFRSSVIDALRTVRLGVVIPCDDPSAAELHAIHESHAEWRDVIHTSLGEPSCYAAVDSRAGLLGAVSEEAAVSLPAWQAINSRNDLSEWLAMADFRQPWVLKQEATGGGTGVRIVKDRVEAEWAYADLVCRRQLAVRLKRRGIDFLFGLNTRRIAKPQQHMVVQQYIAGRAANVAMFCHNGRVLASVEVEAISRFTEVSPSAAVRRIQHDGMHQAAVAVARRLGLSGFHGIDFILEDATDRAFLLELNPRVTPTSHLAFGAGHDLIAAAATAWKFSDKGRTAVPLDTVALFPRQQIVDASSAYLTIAHVDVPEDCPALAERLVRRASERDLYGYITHGLHRLGKYIRMQPRVEGPSF